LDRIAAAVGFALCIAGPAQQYRPIAACEVDVYNAVVMAALSFASGRPATGCWNNNYGEEDDKCILFHCGPVNAS